MSDVTVSLVVNEYDIMQYTLDWLTANTNYEDHSIMIVLWDNAEDKTLEWCRGDSCPYKVVEHQHNENAGFIWNLYQCWNMCVREVDTEYAVPLGDDYYAPPNWLGKLMEHAAPDRIVCPVLVERGVMPSHHQTRDFGFPPDIWQGAFNNFSDSMSSTNKNCKKIPIELAAKPYVVSKTTYIRHGGEPDRLMRGVPGDVKFIQRAMSHDVKLMQVTDCAVYHAQGAVERDRNY